MSVPTFNKYRSTTIYGNLSVRDFTNSAGTSVIESASVDLSGNFISRGDSTFTKKVVCNALLADINANNILTTKQYVDNAVSTGGSVSLSGTNAFTGFNSYNTNFPTSTLVSGTTITDDSIVNKRKNDTLYSSVANEVKTNTANTFTNSIYQTSSGIDQNRTLPSATENKFIATSFLEGVVFGKGFGQDGSDINYLDNLTLGGASSSNDLVLAYDTGIVQAGTAVNSLKNLTLADTGLIIQDATNITQITINPTDYIILGVSNPITIAPEGITQNQTTGINTFKGETIFDGDATFNKPIAQNVFSIDQNRTIPSGVENKFITTSFLEAVGVEGVLTTNALTTNGIITTNTRIRLPINTNTPDTTANQLGHRINGTITSSIASATQVNLSAITLPFGIYIVVGNVVFQSNATAGTITKYQIGFNNAGTTTFTSAVVGYGGTTSLATTASNTTQLALTTTEVVSITTASQSFRLIANITYATTTMSINTSLSKFTAVRIA